MCIFAATGGSVNLQGGEGGHGSVHDGSDGGSLVLSGGKSYGSGFHDDGGSINITSGASLRGDGGNVSIASGSSDGKSSESLFCFESFQLTSHALKIYIADQITAGGHLRMFLAYAGTSGMSGDMSFGTWWRLGGHLIDWGSEFGQSYP